MWPFRGNVGRPGIQDNLKTLWGPWVVSTAIRQNCRLNICACGLLFGRWGSSVSLRRVTRALGPDPFLASPGPPSHQLFGRMDVNHLLWREIRALVPVFFLINRIIHSLIVKFGSRGNGTSRPVDSSSMSRWNWQAVFSKESLRHFKSPLPPTALIKTVGRAWNRQQNLFADSENNYNIYLSFNPFQGDI